ncbi:MAG: hypothetical protein AAB757_01635 [Patescibacteria group bacterium]
METSLVIGILVFLVGAFFLQGLRRITADPPHVTLLTFFGERIEKIKKEGWRFFPFYPYVFGFIEINISKVDHDLLEQIVRTPDKAELGIPLSLTWTPDYEGYNQKDPTGKDKWMPGARQLITFLNNKGESGVKNILEDIVRERLREWAFSSLEGPQNWQEAMAAQEEAVAVLLKAILGEALEPIPSAIPTSILMRYFNEPQIPLTDSQKKVWGENWNMVLQKINEEALQKGKEPEQHLKEVREAVKQRREVVIKARQADGHFHLPQLGIVINRLNIGEIKIKGKLAEVAEFEVKKERERAAEVYEVETDLLKAKKLEERFRGAGKEITLEEAFRIIMEWKTTREGRGFTIPGIAPALADLAKTFLSKGGK